MSSRLIVVRCEAEEKPQRFNYRTKRRRNTKQSVKFQFSFFRCFFRWCRFVGIFTASLQFGGRQMEKRWLMTTSNDNVYFFTPIRRFKLYIAVSFQKTFVQRLWPENSHNSSLIHAGVASSPLRHSITITFEKMIFCRNTNLIWVGDGTTVTDKLAELISSCYWISYSSIRHFFL